jgi:hypothetical protein
LPYHVTGIDGGGTCTADQNGVTAIIDTVCRVEMRLCRKSVEYAAENASQIQNVSPLDISFG